MTYQFDTIVTKQEADALKEMIFRRVRERNEVVTEEFQSDVMDMARSSFVSENNPFSKIISDSTKERESGEESSETKNTDIGFPIKSRELGQRISVQNRLINEQLAGAAVQTTMQEARVGLSSKSSFMGALNFLNSQGAVSLLRARSDKFDIIV